METRPRPDDGATRALVHIIVGGRVQGVFFRQSTCDRARALGLAGAVENLPDGCVAVRAEGPRDALDALIAFCHQGPPAARVDSVDVRWCQPEGLAGPFEVAR